MSAGSGKKSGGDGAGEKLFSRRSLIAGGILSAFLIAAIVFAGVSWNSGEYEKIYETLDYEVRVEEEPDLLEGVEYASQIGQVGSQVTYYTQDGKRLHAEVVREPVDEIIVRGAKSYREVEEEVRQIILGYCEAWAGRDYAAMVGMCADESLYGTAPGDLERAFGVSTESLVSYTLGEIAIYTPDEWSARDEGGHGGRDALSSQPSAEGAGIICEAQLDLSMASDYYEPADLQGIAYAVFSGGQWGVQYFGPLGVMDIEEQRDITRESFWSGQTSGRVNLKSLILYTDRFSLLFEEVNTTLREDDDARASNRDGSLLRNVSVEVSPRADTKRINGLCSDVPSELERGASQLCLFSFRPGLRSGDALNVEVAGAAFSPMETP